MSTTGKANGNGLVADVMTTPKHIIKASDNKQLNSAQLTYALNIIQKKFPKHKISCLSPFVTSHYPSFLEDFQQCIYILNVSNHWVVLERKNASTFFLFSSFPDLKYLYKLNLVFDKFFSFLSIKQSCFTIFVPSIETQSGGIDCGLYCVAYSYSLCSNQKFDYSQKKMRKHFNECIDNNEFTKFPPSLKSCYNLERTLIFNYNCVSKTFSQKI